MLGVFLNMILFALGILSIAAALVFFFTEKDNFYVRVYTLFFGYATLLICLGYSIMSIMTDTSKAWIPRIFGLYGIDVFMIFELAYLTRELKFKLMPRSIVLGFFTLWIFFDLLIFGRPSSLNYVRYPLYTAYENRGDIGYWFHYLYILVIAIVLISLAVKWYKSKFIKRDKAFVLEVVFANFAIFFAAIPDIFHSFFSSKYPTFGYSVAFAFLYFSWWFACRWHISFTPAVKNVCQEIFYTIDIPILIFDMEGQINTFNPKASVVFNLQKDKTTGLRDLFTLTDVETLRLLKKAKEGKGGQYSAAIKKTGEPCMITTSVKFDYAGEVLCIIGTVTEKV
jgi:PAS domain-containing protein